METFLLVMAVLSGPIIGAAIGLLTNWIAIKMMFRPYREVYIGKWKLPFTPGIMPRRQKALADALGRMISESLVQKDDLKNALLSDAVTDTVVNGILALPPIRQSGEVLFGSAYDQQRERVLDALTARIAAGVASLDLADIIAKEGAAAITHMTPRNPLIAMFVNESTIASVSAPLAERLIAYVDGDGRERIRTLLEGELAKIEEKPIGSMLGDPEELRPILTGLYRRLVTDHADTIASHFQIKEVVEKKVQEMRPEDLEQLVLSVMKKELNAVIRLGAVIGFLRGLFNTVIDLIGI